MQYLRNVVTLELDADKCVGCGRCLEVCPHAVFAVEDRRARIRSRDDCMECGACAKNCPAGAISVNPGVGCAAAVISGKLKGTGPTCGCADAGTNSRCCR
jgi:NAD-dependent dihydropyrimidine dehydrogenase PreA subunit